MFRKAGWKNKLSPLGCAINHNQNHSFNPQKYKKETYKESMIQWAEKETLKL